MTRQSYSLCSEDICIVLKLRRRIRQGNFIPLLRQDENKCYEPSIAWNR